MSAGKYVAALSMARCGWCVFLNVLMEFHAGPFPNQAAAESEAKRLNQLGAGKEAE